MPADEYYPEPRALSLGTGADVWLKMEVLQPSGSFKLRGVGLPVAVLAAETGGSDSLAQALAAGECITLPAITSCGHQPGRTAGVPAGV